MAAVVEEKVRGYLVVSVHEASGKNKEDAIVWDPSFVEGFVKVEIRGGPRNVKVQSKPKRVLGNSINWGEDIHLEVLEGSTELRLMLCREKKSGARIGTSVIAACGIYVNDILDAVPIDKYFELFKPGAGGEGGFIRIGMNFVTDKKDLQKPSDTGTKSFAPQLSFKGYQADSATNGAVADATAGMAPDTAAEVMKRVQEYEQADGAAPAGESQPKKNKKGRFPIVRLLIVLGVAGAAAAKFARK